MRTRWNVLFVSSVCGWKQSSSSLCRVAGSTTSAGWQVTKDGNTFSLELAVSPSSRTVDYLRDIPTGKRGGAHIRVVPRPGNGSVIIMTLPLLRDAISERVIPILSQELETLIKLCGAR